MRTAPCCTWLPQILTSFCCSVTVLVNQLLRLLLLRYRFWLTSLEPGAGRAARGVPWFFSPLGPWCLGATERGGSGEAATRHPAGTPGTARGAISAIYIQRYAVVSYSPTSAPLRHCLGAEAISRSTTYSARFHCLQLAEAPLVCVRAVLQLTAQSGVGGTVSSVQDSSECPEFVSEAYVLV